MEALSKIQGTELPDISTPTYSHFIPQLCLNPLVQKANPQTKRYGFLPSQELDIYLPPIDVSPAGNVSKPPLFIFYYGGGYLSGRKQMPLRAQAGDVYAPDLTELLRSMEHKELFSDPSVVDHLYHQNIGSFIANRGFVVVIPDYRLVNMSPEWNEPKEGDAVFPSGAEDVMLSMQWAVDHLSDIADTKKVYAMGHSAGANHLATALLLPDFVPSKPDLLKRLSRVVTLSATFDYIHSRESRKLAWSRYFGGFEMVNERCPTGLATRLGDEEAIRLPELLCLHAAKDHFGAIDPQKRFWDTWVSKGGRGEMRQVPGKEHNHMSTIYGIGCGDAEVEQWLVEALKWCLEQS
jgi:acetyl esterase/lipase